MAWQKTGLLLHKYMASNIAIHLRTRQGDFSYFGGESVIRVSCHQCASVCDCNLMMIHSYHDDKDRLREQKQARSEKEVPTHRPVRNAGEGQAHIAQGELRTPNLFFSTIQSVSSFTPHHRS